jgi:hypothetical protein
VTKVLFEGGSGIPSDGVMIWGTLAVSVACAEDVGSAAVATGDEDVGSAVISCAGNQELSEVGLTEAVTSVETILPVAPTLVPVVS